MTPMSSSRPSRHPAQVALPRRPHRRKRSTSARRASRRVPRTDRSRASHVLECGLSRASSPSFSGPATEISAVSATFPVPTGLHPTSLMSRVWPRDISSSRDGMPTHPPRIKSTTGRSGPSSFASSLSTTISTVFPTVEILRIPYRTASPARLGRATSGDYEVVRRIMGS